MFVRSIIPWWSCQVYNCKYLSCNIFTRHGKKYLKTGTKLCSCTAPTRQTAPGGWRILWASVIYPLTHTTLYIIHLQHPLPGYLSLYDLGLIWHLPVDLSPDAPRRPCPFPSWWPYVTPTGCRVIWLKRWPPLLDACCSSVLWCLLESCERPVTWLVTTPSWKEAGECQQSKYPALLIREGSSHCILEPLEEALPSLTTQQDQL